MLTKASKLSNTSDSHGVLDEALAVLSNSIPSPNNSIGLFVRRSLYLDTMLPRVSGFADVEKPQRTADAPLSITIGVCLCRRLSVYSAGASGGAGDQGVAGMCVMFGVAIV